MVGRLTSGLARSPFVLTIRLVGEAGRPLALVFGLVALVSAVLPPILTLALGAFVGQIPAAAAAGSGSPAAAALTTATVLLAVIFLVFHLRTAIADGLAEVIGLRVEQGLQEQAMRAAIGTRGIEQLERSDVRDDLSRAQSIESSLHPPAEAIRALAVVLAWNAGAYGQLLILATFEWWLPALLVMAHLPYVRWAHRQRRAARTSIDQASGPLRRSGYVRDLLLDPPAAKEVRIFGLGAWLGERVVEHWLEGMRPIWRTRLGDRPLLALAFVSLVGGYGVAYLLIALAAQDGRLGPGQIVIYAQAAAGLELLFPTWRFMLMSLATAGVPAVRGLRARLAALPDVPAGDREAIGLPEREIRFEGVSFHYPGHDRPVLDGLDLTIPAGRSLALVGVNGAGKTTLVKLLAGLYAPSSGRVTVDGVDVRTLDLEDWRRQLGIVFQDYVRYPLTARENVEVGALELAGDRPALDDALDLSGARAVVARLSDGEDTALGTEFGGVDLSGGEWQRLALARALFATRGRARVLVLDEPTASLDVRAEAEVFDRFLELTRGLTTVLISHRFSSVRHADQIAVLDAGRVIELGSHDDLVARRGRYAALFALQAAAFAAEPAGA